MLLPSVRDIKAEADRAFQRAREPQKVILPYVCVMVLLAALLTVSNAMLSDRIADTGGLANFGLRSILSTIQSVLPMAQTVIMIGLEFGYLHAILRMSRGQYADHTDLKVGFRRFGAICRMTMWQYFLLFGIVMMLFYLSVQIFLLTPWATPLIELLTPFVSTTMQMDVTAMMDDATMDAAIRIMLPMLIIYAILCVIVVIPMLYRFRMAAYVLLDDPQGRGFAALKTSTRIMRKNKFRLFKLDLSFWWFYGLMLLANVVAYGDVILAMVGIQLPINEIVAFYLFFFLYLVMLFAIYYFLRNPVEFAYAKAYDAIRDKPVDNGVVLGNIFDM